MPVLHWKMQFYGLRAVRFHQAQTSSNISLRHVLFEVTAAPKNKKNILTNKRTFVRIRFLFLFGSHISGFQGLSQEVVLVYYSRGRAALSEWTVRSSSSPFPSRKMQKICWKSSTGQWQESKLFGLSSSCPRLHIGSIFIWLDLAVFPTLKARWRVTTENLHFITVLKVLKKPFWPFSFLEIEDTSLPYF